MLCLQNLAMIGGQTLNRYRVNWYLIIADKNQILNE